VNARGRSLRESAPNAFGAIQAVVRLLFPSMASQLPDVDDLFETAEIPAEAPTEFLDDRELPPPQPLQRTLERVTAMEENSVLIQYNDRVPQHLYPRLSDRGFDFETVDDGGVVVTAIWHRDDGPSADPS